MLPRIDDNFCDTPLRETYQHLCFRRREIMEFTHAGMKPHSIVWEELAEDMREAGFENMANNLVERWERMI